MPGIAAFGARYAAVGIDMAAQEGNWGISVIALDGDLSSGSLRLLLPHRFKVGDFKLKHLIKPSAALIGRIVRELADHNISAAIAVDVPFGWPQEHSLFLEEWSAARALPEDGSLPSRRSFEYRLCDRAMMELLRKQNQPPAVLAVGADKIACAAFQWATQRVGLPGFERVDVGYDPATTFGCVCFETYPSAFVRLNYPSCARYKTLTKASEGAEPAEDQVAERYARHHLLDAIRDEYHFDEEKYGGALDVACATSASDAFDGFISAITAWDYLRWRTQSGTMRLSSPVELLGSRIAGLQKDRIEKEGWILIRLPANAETPIEQTAELFRQVAANPADENTIREHQTENGGVQHDENPVR